MPRSLSLIFFSALLAAFEPLPDGVFGLAVGRTEIGFSAPGLLTAEFPALGPGELCPFGPGDGATPVLEVICEAPWVGLGLGTPAFGAGAAVACATAAAGLALGAAVDLGATGAVVGAVVAAGGAGVAGLFVGAADGTGFADGAVVGAVVGTGLGAIVGAGVVIATC